MADFTAKGFPLTGGRLDYMDNQTVAALIYQRDSHIINVFIYPDAGHASPGDPTCFTGREAAWSYWVVSDLNVSELRELVAMLRGLSS